MIEQSVRIHDRHQIELKLAYKPGNFKKTKAYDISLFFFVPTSLGVTPATYSRRDFFNDLTTHIRIKTPAILLRDIASGPDSPLRMAEAAMERLTQQPGKEHEGNSDRQLKMFCCILKSTLRDHVAAIDHRASENDQSGIAEQYLGHVTDAIKQFRALRKVINVPSVKKGIFEKYLFADEYISLLVESYTYALLEALRTRASKVFDVHKKRLMGLIASEIAYRNENNYPSIPNETSDNETLIFRKSVLKKFFESVLFLWIRAEREGTLAKQSVYALAAGISMIFATVIAFMFQRKFGQLTFPLFIALVISYMFKDRIKELLRRFLNIKIRRFFFDRRQHIYGDYLSSERIGMSRESFDYVTESKLPANIWRLRNRDHITEIENGWVGETVIRYRRRIKLLEKWIRQTQRDFRTDGIIDIIRINFSKYLLRMDEPQKQLWITNGSEYREIYGQRVYHINLIAQYESGEYRDEQRFRIVVNKEGIKRVEPVSEEHTVLRHVMPETGKDLFAGTDSD